MFSFLLLLLNNNVYFINTLILEKRFSTELIINLESSTQKNEKENSDDKLKNDVNFINEIKAEKHIAPNPSDNNELIVSNEDVSVKITENQEKLALNKLTDKLNETETLNKSIHHVRLAERHPNSSNSNNKFN